MFCIFRVSRLGPYESSLEKLLLDRFSASSVSVTDMSSGCGTSYHIKVSSPSFCGMSKLKQHRLVQDTLKHEIPKWHAVKIDTE